MAIDEEPYEVPHDDADEFLFDVGGEADIFSCKALFATDTEIKCVYKDFFDAEKCRPIWYYKTDYLPSSASGPDGCECAFEERIMSCDGGNLCLKEGTEGYDEKVKDEEDRKWQLIKAGITGAKVNAVLGEAAKDEDPNANNLVNDFLNV